MFLYWPGSTINKIHGKTVTPYVAISALIAAITISFGISALAGWFFQISILTSMGRGWASMKPNTAIALIAAGLALGLRCRNGRLKQIPRTLAIAFSVITSLIGLISIGEYLLPFSLSIDELVFHKTMLATEVPHAGRPAFLTALGLCFVGSALLTLDLRLRSRFRYCEWLAVGAILVGFVPILGYIFGVSQLYPIYGSTSIAVQTASLLLLLGIGILCARPHHGMMAIISADEIGGFFGRRFLPLAVIFPMINASMEVSLDTSASEWAWENQPTIVISELTQEQRYPETVKPLREQGMNSACILPMTVPTRRLGAMVLASARPSAYTQADLKFLHQAAALVAMSIDNTLSHQALSQDKNRVEVLLEISRALSSSLHLEQIFPQISEALRRVMSMEYASISVPDKHRDGMNLFLIHPPLKEKAENIFSSNADSIAAPALAKHVAECYSRAALEQSRSPLARRLLDQGIRYACCFPLITSRGVVGTLNVACKHETPCDSSEKGLMMQISNYIAIALENASAYQEIASLKAKLAEEKLYLEDEIRTELNFEEIIGESALLKRALTDARTVAPSPANVLILGETGTGKELIARAIHKMSGRKENSFIKLNCAAIPTGLLESELFGHEKGAFTGAINQKIGRLELANGGTLFLDEVGDIPLELQPKLLRVLQDQEFERLGSTRTVKANVRLIAATNRDLPALVAAREFRIDLYYRLKVFPIHLPTLRDRRQDIPVLVRYFVQRLSRRMNKVIDSIPTATMDTLTSWDWPGNIRELENFMERSVILSKGPTLTIPAAELRPLNEVTSRRDTSLETAEREHILRILRETGGVISGMRGAAARLGLKRTTLQSKMQKLGISRMDYQS